MSDCALSYLCIHTFSLHLLPPHHHNASFKSWKCLTPESLDMLLFFAACSTQNGSRPPCMVYFLIADTKHNFKLGHFLICPVRQRTSIDTYYCMRNKLISGWCGHLHIQAFHYKILSRSLFNRHHPESGPSAWMVLSCSHVIVHVQKAPVFIIHRKTVEIRGWFWLPNGGSLNSGEFTLS